MILGNNLLRERMNYYEERMEKKEVEASKLVLESARERRGETDLLLD